MINVELTNNELERYSRQILYFGVEVQKKLKSSKVMIAGIGGLGSLSATYLTAIGIGNIILVDKEKVELSNLNRQILYWTKDLGKAKVKVATEKLHKLNPEVKIEAFQGEINENNVEDFVRRVNLVVDGMDNWRTRFIINDACVKFRIPFIHAGIHSFFGQLMVIYPGKGPCLRCIMPKIPTERKPIPVLGVTPAVLASLQVVEAIKSLTGMGTPSIGWVIHFNGENMSLDKFRVSRSPECPVCGSI